MNQDRPYSRSEQPFPVTRNLNPQRSEIVRPLDDEALIQSDLARNLEPSEARHDSPDTYADEGNRDDPTGDEHAESRPLAPARSTLKIEVVQVPENSGAYQEHSDAADYEHRTHHDGPDGTHGRGDSD